MRCRYGVRSSLVRVIRATTPGNLTGALTSCAVFLCALFTDFKGLRELGLIAGAGLILCLLSMTLVLPAGLVLTEGARRPRGRVACFGALTGALTGALAGGAELASQAPAQQRRVWVLLGAAIVTLGLAPFALRLQFASNLLELQAPGLESVRWQRRLAADSASETWFGAIVVDDVQQLTAVLERAAREPAIGATRSVLEAIAPPSPHRDALRASLHQPLGAEPAPAVDPAGADADGGLSVQLGRALQQLDRLIAAARVRGG
jgi:predicted exporter